MPAPPPRAAARPARPRSERARAPPSRLAHRRRARRAATRPAAARRRAPPAAARRRARSRRRARTRADRPASSVVRTGLAREKRLERHVAEILARGRHRDEAGVGVEREQRLVVDLTRRNRTRPATPSSAARLRRRSSSGPRPTKTARASGACGSASSSSAGRFHASRRPDPEHRVAERRRCGTGPRAAADGTAARSRIPLNRRSRAATVCELAKTLRASESPTRSISRDRPRACAGPRATRSGRCTASRTGRRPAGTGG